jgi:hypothetical protein
MIMQVGLLVAIRDSFDVLTSSSRAVALLSAAADAATDNHVSYNDVRFWCHTPATFDRNCRR